MSQAGDDSRSTDFSGSVEVDLRARLNGSLNIATQQEARVYAGQGVGQIHPQTQLGEGVIA